MIVWDVKGTPRATFDEHGGQVNCVAFSPDGKQLASGCWDTVIRLWNLEAGQREGLLVGPAWGVENMAYSPDGSLLAATALAPGQSIRIWDVASRKLLRIHTTQAQQVAFLPKEKMLMAGGGNSEDPAIRFFDLQDDTLPGQPVVHRWKLHAGRVYSITRSALRGELISTGQDGKIILYNPAAEQADLEVTLDVPIRDFDIVAGGEQLAVAGPGRVQLLDVSTGSMVAELAKDDIPWKSVAVDRRGKLLAAGSNTGKVQVWDIANRSRRLGVDVGDRISHEQLVFSPDGTRLAVVVWSPRGDSVQLFDTANGTLVHSLPASAPMRLAISPDGRRLVVGSQNDLLVWDTAGAKLLHTLRGHSNSIRAIAFSPDGRWIASGSIDRSIRLWAADSGQLQRTLGAHRSDIESLSFSPDSRSLAAADHGGCVKLWHVATGRELLELVSENLPVWDVAFFSGGNRIAYLLESGVLRIIQIRPATHVSSE